MTIIIFIVILGLLVFVHELGHFLSAKAFGIRVIEFGIGFPPRAWSIIKRGTRYSLNWIPIGGFVRMWGENGLTEDDENIPDSSGKPFFEAKRYEQAIVIVAGVVFNVIFAWMLLTAGYINGLPQSVSSTNHEVKDPKLMILSVMPDSPAQKSGLLSGDQILSITTGAKTINTPKPEDIINTIRSSNGNEVLMIVSRFGEEKAIRTEPEKIGESGAYAIGIIPDMVGIVSLPIHKAMYQAIFSTKDMILSVGFGLITLVKDVFGGGNVVQNLAGPIGIAGMVGDASELGLGYLISFTAFISINLALLNILPIPALDGGRLLFIIIESAIRKNIKREWQNYLNITGFIALIMLLVFATINDILRIL